MATENEELKNEVQELKELVNRLYSEIKRGTNIPQRLTGVAVKTSDLMNGFQGAISKSIKSQNSGNNRNGENIQNFIVKDMEVEFTAPIIADRSEDEPILLIPNIKSVNTESPLVRLNFKISNVPDKEEQN